MGRAFPRRSRALLLLFGSIAVVADDSQLPQRLRQLDAARAAFARTPDRTSAYLLARALLSYGHVRPSSGPNEFWDEAEELLRIRRLGGGDERRHVHLHPVLPHVRVRLGRRLGGQRLAEQHRGAALELELSLGHEAAQVGLPQELDAGAVGLPRPRPGVGDAPSPTRPI